MQEKKLCRVQATKGQEGLRTFDMVEESWEQESPVCMQSVLSPAKSMASKLIQRRLNLGETHFRGEKGSSPQQLFLQLGKTIIQLFELVNYSTTAKVRLRAKFLRALCWATAVQVGWGA